MTATGGDASTLAGGDDDDASLAEKNASLSSSEEAASLPPPAAQKQEGEKVDGDPVGGVVVVEGEGGRWCAQVRGDFFFVSWRVCAWESVFVVGVYVRTWWFVRPCVISCRSAIRGLCSSVWLGSVTVTGMAPRKS